MSKEYGVQKESYEAPQVTTIGSLRELTQVIDKCGGTSDTFLPLLLTPVFAVDCEE